MAIRGGLGRDGGHRHPVAQLPRLPERLGSARQGRPRVANGWRHLLQPLMLSGVGRQRDRQTLRARLLPAPLYRSLRARPRKSYRIRPCAVSRLQPRRRSRSARTLSSSTGNGCGRGWTKTALEPSSRGCERRARSRPVPRRGSPRQAWSLLSAAGRRRRAPGGPPRRWVDRHHVHCPTHSFANAPGREVGPQAVARREPPRPAPHPL